MNLVKNWAKERLYKLRMAGGELVDSETAKKRLDVCNSCEFKGVVEIPVIGITDIGCTVCGCPFATKPLMKTYFDMEKMEFIIAKCPLEVNRWDFSKEKNSIF